MRLLDLTTFHVFKLAGQSQKRVPRQPQLSPDKAVIAAIGIISVRVGERPCGADDHCQHLLLADRTPRLRKDVEVAEARAVNVPDYGRATNMKVSHANTCVTAHPASPEFLHYHVLRRRAGPTANLDPVVTRETAL